MKEKNQKESTEGNIKENTEKELNENKATHDEVSDEEKIAEVSDEEKITDLEDRLLRSAAEIENIRKRKCLQQDFAFWSQKIKCVKHILT